MLQNLTCDNCIIRSSTCFSDLGKEDLDELIRNKISTVYKKGQTIFSKGMMPTGIYCLNKGGVKISKKGIGGKEQIVRFVMEGGLLGIRSMMGGRKYSASAITLEDSIVCYIDRDAFFKLTTKYPDISHCVLTTICSLLADAEDKMASMTQKPVRERLAEGLLVIDGIFNKKGGSHTVDYEHSISLSREDLANSVGTTTETVIRLLSEFKEEKLVEIDGKTIILVDREGLEEIAG